MGGSGVKVGVQIMKFVIIGTRMCYRSICSHPFVVGILLLSLFLYRSFPYMFSILVSTSPVLVCTAVLLGALLSFGDPSIVSESEDDDKTSRETVGLKTRKVVDTIVVEEDGCFGKDSRHTELRREFVNVIEEEPLLEKSDNLAKSELDHDNNDIGFSSMSTDYNSSEVEKLWINESKNEQEDAKFERNVDLGDPSFSHGEDFQTRFPAGEKVQTEHSEDYISAEGSIDFQRDSVVSSLDSQKQSADDIADCLFTAKNLEDYKSEDGSVDAQTSDQLEPSLASWKQFDLLGDRLYAVQDIEEERCLDYNLAEGSSEAQMRDYIDTSLRSWEQMGSDHDEDAESDSGSDGAESSSPDASMVDIIPMLDELHPLLDDENPQAGKLSRQSSAATIEGSAILPDSSIHSDDENDHNDEAADDNRSDADDDNEEGSRGGKEDSGKSVIMWTEDDQKNLMDLGTSELERNQRLESLIARRRARKMAGDRNLIDLDGMELPFPVTAISTKRNNPFDFPQDSYADLGLPPIPGSAPSIMLARRNPFDLPYDSSEEKPDLMGDSFQQEFMELTHKEAFNQREALFRRNETFNLGSSGFDFGRPSRFKPYFMPERTDSDMMSYSSLQRQLSELSESKASSAAETESNYVGVNQEEKKLEHDPSLEVEPSEIDNASVFVEHGSQSFEDLESLSGEEESNYVLSELEAELGTARYSRAAGSDVMSNSSLQRNFSGHSDSKTSSIAEKERTSVGANQEEKQVVEHDSAQEVGPSSEIDDASVLEEHGSQSSQDLDSLSDEEQAKKDFVHSVLEVELGRAKSAAAAVSFPSETSTSADNSLDYREEEPWLAHSKVSHSDIQSLTEVLNKNHRSCSSQSSAPNTLRDENMVDVNSCLLNTEKSQPKNFANVDIPVNYSQGSSASDVTSGLSLETSEHNPAAEVDFNHAKEPIYDWSPLKQNYSLSSDLQSETSGLDLYQLSRNLFVFEEFNVHNQDSDNISQHTNQDADSKCLIMNDIGEGSVLGSTNFSSELNQLSKNSQKLALAKEEGHSSMGSSDRELKDEVSEEKVSPHEVEHILMKEEGYEIQFGNTASNDRNLNDMPSAYGQEFVEDSLKEKNEAAVLANNLSPVHSISSSLQVELKIKIEEEMIADQQIHVSASSFKNQEYEVNEMLISSQDENQFLQHGTDIHDLWSDPAEQEQTITHRNLEEFDQINKVDEPVTVLMSQDPQQETLSCSGESIVSSCQAKDSEKTSTGGSAIKEHVHDILETRHACFIEENHRIFEGFEGSITNQHILNEDQNDDNEMDEALLAEFDAVGEFRVSDIVPYLESNSTIPAEVTGEVQTGTETPVGHELSIENSSPVVNFESEGKITGTNLSRTKEWDLDSHTRYVSTELLDLEAQPVQDIDYNEEVQKSMVAEPSLAEFTRTEIKTALFSEDAEPGGCNPEATLKTDVVFNSGDSAPKIIQPDLALLEAHNLDSNRREAVSEKPVMGVKITIESVEDIEKVEAEIDKSGTVEAPLEIAETGDDPMGSVPLQIESGIKQISPLVEEGTAYVVGHSDGSINDAQEFSVLVDSLALESEGVKETLAMPVLDASVATGVGSENQFGRNTSEQLLLGKDSKVIQESLLVGVSIGSALDSEHQLEKSDSTRSGPLQIEEDFKEMQEFISHEGSTTRASEFKGHKGEIGTSEPLQLGRDIHEIEETHDVGISNPLLESEENKEMVGYRESEALQTENVIEELQDWHVVDGTAPIEVDPLQTYTDIKEIQKSPTAEASIHVSPIAEASIPVPKPEDQILTANSEEPEVFLIDRNGGELQGLPAVDAEVALAVDSEGQLGVGFVEHGSLQMDGNIKVTQESSALQTSYASVVECKDKMEIKTLLKDTEVQTLQDYQLESQQQLQVDVPNASESSTSGSIL